MKRTLKKILPLLAALIAALALTACGTKTKIDLQKYILVTLTGANGYGRADADIDTLELEALILSSCKEGESELAQLSKLWLIDEIEYELDKTENLSNGDKITVTVRYPDSLEDVLDADLSPKSGESWTVEVSELGDAEKKMFLKTSL